MLCYAKSLQSCLTLCDPIDGSPPGSPVPGILQARTLEWVAISFSNAWKWKVKGKSLSSVWLLATPWTAACQAPPSMGFSRQEYWSRVPSPSPKNVQNKSKHKNNKCFSWVTAVRVPLLTGSHSLLHFPRMPYNTVLISGPAVRVAHILFWSYSCVFSPPMSTAIRTSVFSFMGALNYYLYIQ